ncbi:MAG: hypothetical protein PHD02_03370 [Bacilli bacterium]|nr:hypothetical protein [Bacilli bacterium]
MSKIKLKITSKVSDEETISYVEAIRQNNKYIYKVDNTKIIVEILDDNIQIKTISDIENHIILGKNSYAYLLINNKKIEYPIKTKKWQIKSNYIFVEYAVESLNTYILEVIE